MCLYPHFKQDTHFADQYCAASRAHLGKIGMRESPFEDEEGYRVWIEGEVYNLQEVINRFGWRKLDPDNQSFPGWLLHTYKSGNLDPFLYQLDGYFCASLYDPLRRKLLLISDRYGLRMLYWYHRDRTFAWASEVKGLLALEEIDRSIDLTSLPCFMDLGYLMGDHTWFEYIRLIKPATVLEYDINSDKVSQHYYWNWGEIKPTGLSFGDAVDELHEVFVDSVRRRFVPTDRIGIALSGGLDSRAIFAAVNHLYPDYRGYVYTFGLPDCDEIRIAKRVVSRSSWRHEEFLFSSDNWFEPRKQMIWNTDGMLDMMHMHGGEFIKRVADNIDVNLNGYSGDVVAGGGWVGTYPKNTRASSDSLSKYYKSYATLASLDDSYFDLDNAEPGLFMSRVRRFTNMGTVNSLVMVDQRKPFFGNNVIEWAYSIRPEYRESNKIYSSMLQKHFPSYFKDIPWQKTGKPAGIIKTSYLNLLLKVINKIISKAKPGASIFRNIGYTNYAAWLQEPLIANELNVILDPHKSLYAQLTNQDFRKKYLAPHGGLGKIDNSTKILRATTIELYLRMIVG